MFPTVVLNHEHTVEILVLIFSKAKEIYDNFRHSNFTHIGISYFFFVAKSNFRQNYGVLESEAI